MVHNFAWLAQGREPITAADEGELLFVSEKELTIELQKSVVSCISSTRRH
jgi:hypothetical protein